MFTQLSENSREVTSQSFIINLSESTPYFVRFVLSAYVNVRLGTSKKSWNETQ